MPGYCIDNATNTEDPLQSHGNHDKNEFLICFKYLNIDLIERQNDREGEEKQSQRKREIPFAGSVSKSQKEPGLCEVGGRIQELILCA